MITLKSSREIGLMREAGRLVGNAHQLIRSMLRPGITTQAIDAEVERLFEHHQAQPLFKGFPGKVPFPAVTCMSVNEQIVHGIPSSRRLEEGDLLSVDTGCKLNGWCGDSAWTYAIGDVSPLKQRLLEAGEETLRMAIREVGRRSVWSEVAWRMQEYVKQQGFSVVEDFVGHGIGQEMHEDPQVPNYPSAVLREHDFRLEPGLVLAIEPMVNAGSKQSRAQNDHWTVVTKDGKPSVHFEHTIAITVDGPVVLTEGEKSPGDD